MNVISCRHARRFHNKQRGMKYACVATIIMARVIQSEPNEMKTVSMLRCLWRKTEFDAENILKFNKFDLVFQYWSIYGHDYCSVLMKTNRKHSGVRQIRDNSIIVCEASQLSTTRAASTRDNIFFNLLFHIWSIDLWRGEWWEVLKTQNLIIYHNEIHRSKW